MPKKTQVNILALTVPAATSLHLTVDRTLEYISSSWSERKRSNIDERSKGNANPNQGNAENKRTIYTSGIGGLMNLKCQFRLVF